GEGCFGDDPVGPGEHSQVQRQRGTNVHLGALGRQRAAGNPSGPAGSVGAEGRRLKGAILMPGQWTIAPLEVPGAGVRGRRGAGTAFVWPGRYLRTGPPGGSGGKDLRAEGSEPGLGPGRTRRM